MANKRHLARLQQRVVNTLTKVYHALASGVTYARESGSMWVTDSQVDEAARHTYQRVMALLRSTPWQELARRYLPLLVVLSTARHEKLPKLA
jgi:hypothetical protein